MDEFERVVNRLISVGKSGGVAGSDQREGPERVICQGRHYRSDPATQPPHQNPQTHPEAILSHRLEESRSKATRTQACRAHRCARRN